MSIRIFILFLFLQTLLFAGATDSLQVNQSDSLRFRNDMTSLKISDLNSLNIKRENWFGKYALSNDGSPVVDYVFNLPTLVSPAYGFVAYQDYIDDHLFTDRSHDTKFTEIFYADTQEEGQLIRAYHIQGFGLKNYLGINFSRVLSQGFYAEQNTRHTNFSAIGEIHVSDRYRVSAYMLFNKIDSRENGGIAIDTLFEDNTEEFRTVIPVYLSNAETRQKKQAYYLNQSYDLTTGEDHYTIAWDNRIDFFANTYVDVDPADDFLNEEVVDPANILYPAFLDNDTLTFDSTYVQQYTSSVMLQHIKNDKRYWSLGASFKNYRYDYGFGEERFHDLAVSGYWNPIVDKLDLNTEFVINGRNQANYNLSANYKAKKWIVAGNLSRYAADLQQQAYAGNHYQWQNDFNAIQAIHTDAVWQVWKDFSLSFEGNIISDYVFYNTNGEAEQSTKTNQVIKIGLSKDFQFGKFHLDNSVLYQHSKTDEIRIPELTTRNTFYYMGSIFKAAAKVQLGVQLNYFSAFYANSFMPATGIFHLQDEKQIGNAPVIDAFLNLRIKTFKLFLKFENVSEGLFEYNYYASPRYPLADRNFKIGIVWNFFD